MRRIAPLLSLVLILGTGFSGDVSAAGWPFKRSAAKSKQEVSKDTQVERPHTTTTIVLHDGTVAPKIPQSVTLAGQTIDLSRYDLRERFDRELMAMMYMHSSSLLLIKRANRYFPIIEPILQSNGVPDDLKYLACIESHLDPKAVSSAKAAGMWQFMPETARQYGLEVNDQVDERYNVVKATEAACKYLKYAYSLYGDWTSAAASYNTGYGRVTRELDRQKATNALDLWLVEETQRYVFRILACKTFMENPRRYQFYVGREELYAPLALKDTVVTGTVSNWVDLATSLGVSYYDLKAHNTWIRSDSLSNKEGKAYTISYPDTAFKFYNPKTIPVHQASWVMGEE
jgi:hypothetical protein